MSESATQKQTRDIAYKYRHKASVPARFESICPYCGGEILPQANDYVANGEKGWGHARCVNGKVHVCQGDRNPPGCGGYPLCKTRGRYESHQLIHHHPEPQPKLDPNGGGRTIPGEFEPPTIGDLSLVTCDKCLALIAKGV